MGLERQQGGIKYLSIIEFASNEKTMKIEVVKGYKEQILSQGFKGYYPSYEVIGRDFGHYINKQSCGNNKYWYPSYYKECRGFGQLFLNKSKFLINQIEFEITPIRGEKIGRIWTE